MATNLNQKIMSKIYEDYEKFRKDFYEFKNTQNQEIRTKMEQFTEILESIKTNQIMRMTEREDVKTNIVQDLKTNPPLIELEVVKKTLDYIKLTETIDLFYCKELTKYLEIIQYLLTEQTNITDYEDTEDITEQIPPDANIPKILAHLLYRYERADEKEKQSIKEDLKTLPNQEKIKKIMNNEGIEYE